jgi:hypothetical protein
MSGLVTDPSGAAISGASVSITNKATGATRNVTTNSEGLYSFPSLLPGVYELRVEQSGFKTARTRQYQAGGTTNDPTGRGDGSGPSRRDGHNQ